MRLIEWQQQLENYLLGDDPLALDSLLPELRDGPTLSATTGLQIYHNAYRARLLETLHGDYPTCHAWLGDSEFDQLLLAYLKAQPPKHFSLRWLGAGLAEFISGHLVPAQAEPLTELMRLEWAFTLAFDAPDSALLDLARMASLAPEEWPELRIRLQPSVQLVPCRFNSLRLWQSVKQQAEFPGSQLLENEELCLIWRVKRVCQFRALAADEAAALRGMTEQNWNFAELCSQLAPLGEQAPAQAAGWLKQWLVDGLIQG